MGLTKPLLFLALLATVPALAAPAAARSSRFSCERGLRFTIEWRKPATAVLHLPGRKAAVLHAERRASGIAYSNATYRFSEHHDVGQLDIRRGRSVDSYNCSAQF